VELTLPRIDEFELTGDGTSAAWGAVEWRPMAPVRSGASDYLTRAKAAYSAAGLYFLVDCEDRKLVCTYTDDNEDIWTEDVVEVFVQPDEAHPIYFEYELSPLNVELPILVSNTDGAFFGWLPWHYEGDRRVRRATAVRGGAKASMAEVEGWTAEFFIPFALFKGLGNTPPASGTRWRGNIYRIDYDEKPSTQWAWCADIAKFHDYENFGTFVFE